MGKIIIILLNSNLTCKFCGYLFVLIHDDSSILQFLSSDFAVMLFHYDSIMDEWKEFNWSNRVIHVTAVNQTKW